MYEKEVKSMIEDDLLLIIERFERRAFMNTLPRVYFLLGFSMNELGLGFYNLSPYIYRPKGSAVGLEDAARGSRRR